MAYGDFEKMQVGDTVARIVSGGWGSAQVKRATVAKKTATQVTLDNGERYTQRLWLVGDGNGDRWRHGTRIELWTAETDVLLREIEEGARRDNVLRDLRAIEWRSMPQERRDAAWKALKELGVL